MLRFFIPLITLCLNVFCQETKLFELPTTLAESSGLCVYDNFLFSINDSDNSPSITVFDTSGVLVNVCTIENVVNRDWEAITIHDKTIYIGNTGNNTEKPVDYSILIIGIDSVMNKKKTGCQQISFSFPGFKSYDSEGMVYSNDSLFLFTKNHTSPFDGKVNIFGIDLKTNQQIAFAYKTIQLPATFSFENSVTDACWLGDKLVLLTYRYVYLLEGTLKDGWVVYKTIEFTSATQKEGVYFFENKLYITDEGTYLGPASLYLINMN